MIWSEKNHRDVKLCHVRKGANPMYFVFMTGLVQIYLTYCASSSTRDVLVLIIWKINIIYTLATFIHVQLDMCVWSSTEFYNDCNNYIRIFSNSKAVVLDQEDTNLANSYAFGSIHKHERPSLCTEMNNAQTFVCGNLN